LYLEILNPGFCHGLLNEVRGFALFVHMLYHKKDMNMMLLFFHLIAKFPGLIFQFIRCLFEIGHAETFIDVVRC